MEQIPVQRLTPEELEKHIEKTVRLYAKDLLAQQQAQLAVIMRYHRPELEIGHVR